MSRIHPIHLFTLAALAATAPGAFGAGVTLLQDDFESYTNTAAMNAAWNANPGSISTLTTTLPGLPPATTTRSLNHVPTAANQQAARTFNATAIKPSNTNPIYWTFDYYYDGVTNKRMTAGIRTGGATSGGSNILEMGYYNSTYSPFSANPVSGMAVRTVLIPGSGTLPEAAIQNWRALPNTDNTGNYSLTNQGNHWFRFAALIQGNSITYTMDYDRDGTIDSTYVATAPTLDLTGAAFDTVRLGTGLTSTGGGADFDNLRILSLAPGDANFNGAIDSDDYALLDRGFAMTLTGWTNGDFNNDNIIDQNDYLLIDTSYGQAQGLSPAFLSERESQFGDAYVQTLLASVPEPASPLACLFAGLLFTRRRSPRP